VRIMGAMLQCIFGLHAFVDLAISAKISLLGLCVGAVMHTYATVTCEYTRNTVDVESKISVWADARRFMPRP
jgi:hypothetical protein